MICPDDQQGVFPLALGFEALHQPPELVVGVGHVLVVHALVEGEELDPADARLFIGFRVDAVAALLAEAIVPFPPRLNLFGTDKETGKGGHGGDFLVQVGGLKVHPVGLGRVFLPPFPKRLVQKSGGFSVAPTTAIIKLCPILPKEIHPALQAAHAASVRVGDEHRRLVGGPVQVLSHGLRFDWDNIEPVLETAQHAVLQRGHEGSRGGSRPGGVAVGMLENRTLCGNAFQIGRRPAVIAVDAHVIGPGAIDDVEDDVGCLSGAGPAQGRRCPQGHGPGTRRLSLQRQGHGLPRQMGQIHGALSPVLSVGVGLLEQRLDCTILLRRGDRERHRGIVAQHPQPDIQPSFLGDPYPEPNPGRRVRVYGPAVGARHSRRAAPHRPHPGTIHGELGLTRDHPNRQDVESHCFLVCLAVKPDCQVRPRALPASPPWAC